MSWSRRELAFARQRNPPWSLSLQLFQERVAGLCCRYAEGGGLGAVSQKKLQLGRRMFLVEREQRRLAPKLLVMEQCPPWGGGLQEKLRIF